MAKNYFATLLFLLALHTQAQIPGPSGCDIFAVLDADNDGYANFDIEWFVHEYTVSKALAQHGYDLSGYALQLYPSETDLWADTNEITGTAYANTVAFFQYTYLKCTYTGSGPQYDESDLAYHLTCHILQTENPSIDTDQDGLSNLEEDFNANGILTDDDFDADWIPDYLDPDARLAQNQWAPYNTLHLAPNPASSYFAVDFGATRPAAATLQIFDLTGKTLIEQTNALDPVAVAHLGSGVYLVKIQTGDQFQTQKLIIP